MTIPLLFVFQRNYFPGSLFIESSIVDVAAVESGERAVQRILLTRCFLLDPHEALVGTLFGSLLRRGVKVVAVEQSLNRLFPQQQSMLPQELLVLLAPRVYLYLSIVEVVFPLAWDVRRLQLLIVEFTPGEVAESDMGLYFLRSIQP